MKPAAPASSDRRRWIASALSLLAVLGAGCVPTPRRPDGPLIPVFSLSGARLITRVNAAGGAVPADIGQYVPFAFPVAVAAVFNDIYIADAGQSRLFRYDRALDAMAVIPDSRIGFATRIQAGPDGTIYVLDPFHSVIRRYSRNGQLLSRIRPRLETGRYTEFAVEPLSGRLYAVDSAHLFIDEIQPMGTLAIPYQRLDSSGPIAADGRGVLIGDVGCACIAESIQGRAGRRFGEAQIRQPRAIAVDGKRIFALDGFENKLMLVHEPSVEAIANADLGLMAPTGLAAWGGMLFVADGAGRQVKVFRSRTAR
jgi:hypothetical protein